MSIEAWLIIWLACPAIGAAISKSKNRHWSEGFLLGLLLGWIGVIIELCMKTLTLTPGSPQPGWYPDPEGSGSQRYWDGRFWSDLPSRAAVSGAPSPVERGAVQAPIKQCPDCAETILKAAKVCKHCGYRFTPSDTSVTKQTPRPKAPKPAVPLGKSTKVVCHKCQHVQKVPSSETTFQCEECGTRLKRRTTAS